ncbi:hypothetical protein [Vreelandella alkaliphila]|uniref:hypothetical protein n=1 Tax=Vreelandella alkaliphila TaxID=272774 RepID=UPI003FD84776
MSLEFVWVFSKKNINKDWFFKVKNIHGSLIESPIKSTKCLIGKSDCAFILSDSKIPESPNAFFDGECVYGSEFMSFFVPNNIDQYFDFAYKARGSFCLAFSYNLSGVNVVRFANDQLGMYPVLYWSDGESLVVTNNPILSEKVVKESIGISLERSIQNVVNEIVAASPLNTGPFKNMRFLPFDSELVVREGGWEVKRRSGDDFFYNSWVGEDELLDLSILEVTENVKAIAKSSFEIKIADITGGFDSRLVLAAILNSGLENEFFFNTNGKYPNPDANVANFIIEKYGLKKGSLASNPFKRKSRLSTDPLYELSTFSYASSGMKSNIDRHISSLVKNENVIQVGGGFSAYKANKSKSLSGCSPTIDDGVDAICYGNFSLPHEEIKSVRKHIEDIIRNWVVLQGMSVHDALDRYHIEYRTRFHIGLCEHWSRLCQIKAHPLHSPSLVRLAFKVGYTKRLNDKLLFRLMERLNPELCTIPFENRTWRKEAYEGAELAKEINNLKPITLKSKKLFKKEPVETALTYPSPEREICVSSLLENKRENVQQPLIANGNPEWRKSQMKLGRKWHWYKLDEIKYAFDVLLSEALLEGADLVWMESLGKKKLQDFKSVKEVLELHALTQFLIFYQNKEVPLRVGY